MLSKGEQYTPRVTRPVLIFLAGFAWVCVGGGLLAAAINWLFAAPGQHGHSYLVAGIGLALVVHRWGLSPIVDRNLKRIMAMEGRRSVFAFMPRTSYIIIAAMIAMGNILRHSVIPKKHLAMVYVGMGLALILSSTHYMRAFLRERGRGNDE